MAGAGKTTLAKKLEASHQAFRFSPDEWIKAIIKDESDKPELDRLRDPVEILQWKTAKKMLTLGASVILENGFWSKEERIKFQSEAKALGANVELHYLNVSKEELWRRLKIRNSESSSDSFHVTKQEHETWLSWYTPPDKEEASIYDKFFEHKL